jgi:hypothetical protein
MDTQFVYQVVHRIEILKKIIHLEIKSILFNISGWNCKASVPTCPYTSTVAVTSTITLFTGLTVAQWAQCGGILALKKFHSNL